jgi:hypothetical protein
MAFFVRVVRFTFDGHFNVRYGTVELLVSDDQRFLRFDSNTLYDGWPASDKSLNVENLLEDRVLESATTTEQLCEDAGGTGSSRTACMVRVMEIAKSSTTTDSSV